MSSETVQAAADQANREGRLHPSQRTMILNAGFSMAVVWIILFVAAAIMAPIGIGVSADQVRGLDQLHADAGLPPVSYWSLNWQVYLLTVFFLALAVFPARLIWRRVAEVRSGKLDVVPGWTHDYGHVTKIPPRGQHAMYLYEMTDRMTFTYLVVHGKTYRLDYDMRQRVLGNRTNAAILTPRSKILVNVVAA
ncbi:MULTISPECIES: hypothetical protein [unclassified Amycolatopsis]|uniref:hypothetical protein n=1 Tax=unclassified Amycolatopsis TaxID=2618356 RepID=UPI0023B1DD42|nr:hypothetical protein [Amycolatopsis sp. La24]